MKAAAFQRQNEMVVIDAPEPKAAAGEVVLRVHDCGICGSDLHACQYGMGMPPGSIMGHELCGEVFEKSSSAPACAEHSPAMSSGWAGRSRASGALASARA
jgi:threonine dehydrogenase-like Zn-dependent dehydrogenase